MRLLVVAVTWLLMVCLLVVVEASSLVVNDDSLHMVMDQVVNGALYNRKFLVIGSMEYGMFPIKIGAPCYLQCLV